MAISDITKNQNQKSEQSQGNQSQDKPKQDSPKSKGMKSITVTRFRFNTARVFWVILVIILILELYIIYSSIYKNLRFTHTTQEEFMTKVQRIDFDQYDKIVNRLEQVRRFRAVNTLDTANLGPFYGRSNPFSDP